MYEAFYNLTSMPFNMTPDPKFLYLSESHREGLAHLMYGVERKQGITVLTGESGSGKTTLLNAFIQSMGKRSHIAYLVNPELTQADLYRFLSIKFNFEDTDKGEFIIVFNEILHQYLELGEFCILIIDEAQLLSDDVLEQVRLLSNFETHNEKLIQIVLSGTPQLHNKIDSYEFEALKQRTGVVCKLRSLDRYETRQYIEKRLFLCGASLSLFTNDAIETIYACSNGIPRVINNICDHALFIGYSEKQHEIGQDVIVSTAENLKLKRVPTPTHFGWSNDADAADTTVARYAWEVLSQNEGKQNLSYIRRHLAKLIYVTPTIVLIGALVFAWSVSQSGSSAANMAGTIIQNIQDWWTGETSTP